MQAAYELFTELNRLGKFNTVVRLYDKHELEYASSDPYKDRMKSQYELARDNIASLGINVNEFGDSSKITS